jgi:pyruvate dehydrogenase E2 component (dihydrolipoamide acetyltransferase)
MPVKMVQKITAARLTESKQTIPHYYLTVDVKMDNLMKTRAMLNKGLEKSGGKLSVTDLIIKASALALMKVPEVNASWMGDSVRRFHAADISIAVQTEHGLMVPIVKDADTKGLGQISSDVKALAAKARDNKLAPADYTGGTFTISNLGMYGTKSFCAIVNPPQACILAVGGSEVRVIPGAVKGTYEEGSFMSATISCDHRVIDGAVAASWLKEFKANMEDPLTMLL